MSGALDYLLLDDTALLAQCRMQAYRASGPGGQRRNKVATAVRLVHKPTQITAQAEESRYQVENRRRALVRLRRNIACRLRASVDANAPHIPPVVSECLFTPRKGPSGSKRLAVGPKDHRFWAVAAFLLDLLAARGGRVSEAAAHLGITTANFVGALKSEKHLLAAAQAVRKANNLSALR